MERFGEVMSQPPPVNLVTLDNLYCADETEEPNELEDSNTFLRNRTLGDALPRAASAESHRNPPNPAKVKRNPSVDAVSPSRKKTVAITDDARRRKSLLMVAPKMEEDETTPGTSGGTSTGVIRFPHSCRECFNDCLNKLLGICTSHKKLTFAQALPRSYHGPVYKVTETSESEMFELSKQPTTGATVIQLFYIDSHSASRVYAGLMTSTRLSDLQNGLTNKTFGFRMIRRVVYVEDSLPENFVKAYDEFIQAHPRSFHPHPDMRPQEQRYILMEFDYCGETILRARIKPSQAISIIGQVACSLAVAERELQFEHRDLHEDNIWVQPSSNKNQHFLIDGRTCCIKCAGLKVTLLDDNFSRITYNNEVIIRMKSYNGLYTEKTAIYLTMEKIINDRWDLFHPRTNALWLSYLCGHLSDYLTVPNPTGEWQRKLETLSSMQRDLHRFRSADEFVWNYMNKLGHIHPGHDYHPHNWEAPKKQSVSMCSGLFSFLKRKDKKKDDPGVEQH
ncbi:serine/threonine-protein kinase haspin-like isoform X2 [Ornithodoros turicata]|uniref:serine/threonine-protein kinase haspin-like isoform X2 n=1 Tax=Ornithodoros turicata TaxID=34597 RepID=UPI003138AAB0